MSLFSLIITVECFFELFKKFKYLKKKTCFEEENSFYAKKRNSYINFHFSFTSYLYETYLPNERTTGVCNSELIFCASHRSFNFLSFFFFLMLFIFCMNIREFSPFFFLQKIKYQQQLMFNTQKHHYVPCQYFGCQGKIVYVRYVYWLYKNHF